LKPVERSSEGLTGFVTRLAICTWMTDLLLFIQMAGRFGTGMAIFTGKAGQLSFTLTVVNIGT
jgi:hypothetical protein